MVYILVARKKTGITRAAENEGLIYIRKGIYCTYNSRRYRAGGPEPAGNEGIWMHMGELESPRLRRYGVGSRSATLQVIRRRREDRRKGRT